jgi:hypothetical protein
MGIGCKPFGSVRRRRPSGEVRKKLEWPSQVRRTLSGRVSSAAEVATRLMGILCCWTKPDSQGPSACRVCPLASAVLVSRYARKPKRAHRYLDIFWCGYRIGTGCLLMLTVMTASAIDDEKAPVVG